MSKETQVLEMQKYVSSRLWYTAFEICRTCRHNVCSEQSTTVTQYVELKSLIKYNTVMQSENNYQWIEYLLLRKLFPDKYRNNENIQSNFNNMEFQIIMALIEDIPQHIIQELLLYCSNINTEVAFSEICNDFPSSLLFLQKYLTQDPLIVCHVINMLSSFDAAKIPNELQDFYITVLKEITCYLISDKSFFLNKDDKCFFNRNNIMLNNEYLGKFLCVLSNMTLMESKKTEFLKWLGPIVSKTNNIKDIELALYSRKNMTFIDEWKVCMTELHGHLKSAITITDAVKIFNAMFICNDGNITTLNLMEIIKRTMIKQSHWLNDILDICCTFIISNNSKEVAMILSYPPLKHFWMMLLLKFLDHCIEEDVDNLQNWSDTTVICEIFNFLLQSCNHSLLIDHTFNKLNTTIRTYIEVISWILNIKRLHIQENQNNTESVHKIHTISLKRMLYLLENSTVLSLLKEIVNIHEIDHEQIKILLQHTQEPTNIFQAYSSMLNALIAIVLCRTYNTKYQSVTKCLLNMESFLSTLFPVSLRLETMENIFSFLFLSYNDFYHSNNSSPDHIITLNDIHKSVKHNNVNFICNKYAIREILHYLKNSIVSTEIEIRKLRNDNNHTEDLYELNKKVSTLTKLIADANWRLDLHTSSHFRKNIGLFESSVDEANSDTLFKENITYPSNKLDATFYQNNASDSDDTKIKTDSSSETDVIIDNINEWRQSTNMLALNNAVATDINEPIFLINLMLSSKESLVIQCLWENDYVKAQEVVEIFNMEKTPLDGEIKFSQALKNFKQDSLKVMFPLKTENILKENVKTSTLETIRLVAQESIHSSRYTNQFETFIASQEVNMRMLKQNVDNNKILTLSVLDLALTMGKTQQITQSLCDVAMKYVKLYKPLNNTEHSHLFFEVFQLLHENKKDLTMTNLLCNVMLPLSFKEWNEKKEFWLSVMNRYSEFKESQRQVVDEEQNVNLKELKIIQKIITSCNNSKSYLQTLQFYLQNLLTITSNYAGENTAKLSTVTELLNIPLHKYFSYHLFDRNVEPEKLEPIARKLKVDLVYNILISTCPKFPYYHNKEFDNNNINSGCVILNGNFDVDLRNWTQNSPNQCISDILTELIQALYASCSKKSNISHTCLNDLSQNKNIQTILKKTSYLRMLDLSELSVGDETLTFFLNTWNVMFIHTLLHIWADNPPFNNLRHTVSLMSIGYVIGDLGFVTLDTLRCKLLGGLTLNMIQFSSEVELNEPAWQDLDLVQDPRVIFAMINEFSETPQIRVYKSDTLSQDLNGAVNDYLNYYLKKNDYTNNTEKLENNIKIILPYLLGQYQNLENMYKQNENTNSLKENLFSIANYFEFEEDNMIIEYKAAYYSYEILLEYTENFQFSIQNYQNYNNNQQISIYEQTLIQENLLHYLEDRSWILSYLVQKIQNKDATILNNNYNNLRRVTCLENFFNSSWIERLKCFFDGNETLTGIHETVPINELWIWFTAAWENKKWEDSLHIINSLPDNNIIKTFEVQYFKDRILSCLTSEQENATNTKIIKYLYQIKDIYILVQTILNNISKWQAPICEYILIHALHHVDNTKLPLHCKLQMKEILHRITIFRKMLPFCANKCTWYDVAYCTDKINPFDVIQSLITADKFELCLEWLECQSFMLEAQSCVAQDLLIGLLRNEKQDFRQALKFLQSLPHNQSVKICKVVLGKVESTNALSFLTNYLLQHCEGVHIIKYKKTLIGIDILKELKDKERSLYIHLIKEPLLMLEQLLMNFKFETVQKILSMVHENLQDAGISISEFDKTIKFYSEKALDFRVSLQRDGLDNKSKNTQDSTVEHENNEFVMPSIVPTKEEWIPNDKARECSCCRSVIFSMFNRRHHCRRCGRVVCAMCSQHRMQVLGYPSSVLVRVCEDCKRQSALQMHTLQEESSTPSSEILDYWKLTTDETHNKTIRDEFSFEYAPSISLCLAILDLHSDHKAYTSFLLDRCDEMKALLYPLKDGKVNPEVDHTVIIKMIESLLVAVKVKCAKLGFNTGLAHCDGFLSQIDLITTLVHSDCLSLIPSNNIDDHVFRKLRDLFTEKEQWTLALDISTKSGLDTQGVWAAWGKACLKVGYFEQAREKFQHCLDKIISDDSGDWVFLSYSKEYTSKCIENVDDTNFITDKVKSSYPFEEKNSQNHKKNEYIKNRPMKDSPLLTEILQILDNLNTNCYYLYHSYQKTDETPEILSIINNLKAISQGQITIKHVSSFEENIYYKESLYYLLTYGSYNSILEFYLKHEEFEKCLNYILENDLEPELFFTAIYMYCLKTGNAEKLQEAMKTKDPSLLLWKKYLIHVCHCLEKKQSLYILYQLQLFMKDYIRASMTCIRFYTNQAMTYTELCYRVHLLIDAQKHLESELHIGNFSKKRRKSTSSYHHDALTMEMEPSEIDKHINTISRQMEIVKFLGNAEKEGRSPNEFISLFPDIECDATNSSELPTLFGNQQQKTHLAVLAILCGRNIEEGFGIAFRIMQDYNLPSQKVYSLAARVLALKNNVSAVEQLIKCCRSSGASNMNVICDHILTQCIKLMLQRSYDHSEHIIKNQIDILIRLITDIELKISAYIESKQLKTAYLLAVKYSRAQDIRKILKESDRLGQIAIKAICTKWLQHL